MLVNRNLHRIFRINIELFKTLCVRIVIVRVTPRSSHWIWQFEYEYYVNQTREWHCDANYRESICPDTPSHTRNYASGVRYHYYGRKVLGRCSQWQWEMELEETFSGIVNVWGRVSDGDIYWMFYKGFWKDIKHELMRILILHGIGIIFVVLQKEIQFKVICIKQA